MASLYLIPTVLSDSPLDNVLPSNNANIIRQIKVFIVENIRTARRFLKQVDKGINIDELQFFELNQHTDLKQIGSYLDPIKFNRVEIRTNLFEVGMLVEFKKLQFVYIYTFINLFEETTCCANVLNNEHLYLSNNICIIRRQYIVKWRIAQNCWYQI